MVFVVAPPGLGQCGEGTILNSAFLWQDLEVAKRGVGGLVLSLPGRAEGLRHGGKLE